MSRLTDLVFRVLRIHAGDTPVKVKETIIHPTTQSSSPVPTTVQPEVVEPLRPNTQKNNDTLAMR